MYKKRRHRFLDAAALVSKNQICLFPDLKIVRLSGQLDPIAATCVDARDHKHPDRHQ